MADKMNMAPKRKKPKAVNQKVARAAMEVVQTALPIPGPKKVRAVGKAVKAVVRKARKPRNVVLLANRGSDETMAKIAKNEAIRANMRKGASTPEARSIYANAARAVLKESDPKKRDIILKQANKQVKKSNKKKGK